jgi:excisionase family DNA binding protein
MRGCRLYTLICDRRRVVNKRRRKLRATFVEPSGGPKLPTSYTPLEVARAAKVSRQTITRMCQRQEIKAFKFGDLWRIPHPEVERILALKLEAAE